MADEKCNDSVKSLTIAAAVTAIVLAGAGRVANADPDPEESLKSPCPRTLTTLTPNVCTIGGQEWSGVYFGVLTW